VTHEQRVRDAFRDLAERRDAQKRERDNHDALKSRQAASFQAFRTNVLPAAIAKVNALVADNGVELHASPSDAPATSVTVHLERNSDDFAGDATARFSLEHGAVLARLRIHGKASNPQSPFSSDFNKHVYLGLHSTNPRGPLDALTDLVVAAANRLD
jgi:hypothetical protein